MKNLLKQLIESEVRDSIMSFENGAKYNERTGEFEDLGDGGPIETDGDFEPVNGSWADHFDDDFWEKELGG